MFSFATIISKELVRRLSHVSLSLNNKKKMFECCLTILKLNFTLKETKLNLRQIFPKV